MTEYKQAIIVISSLKLPKGKLAAQVAHGAVEAVLRSNDKIVKPWRQSGMKKVVVKVNDEKDLYRLKATADEYGIKTAIITDAGRTVVEPGTVTCMGLGPDTEENIDRVIKGLSLM
ncbi:peptidyl-tRNA hydrolase [Candidatus Woesearchaeota archaeon]|jgi:peptidyl-tRNA hydrolase, PTH2 family|nr:peptidyl-tRNA hydrolase [Candidatus Woesearchaeota archaeon]MBT4387053.1 peptidyl-tRNA hydrolase [Candidatus Woesearchaeota archaeon]MBT4596190.1 peptidyl-tRNA hydrolase [Candidatus Woesearchaeota archaeon]MBT5741587.1 peptidyl-tRNA hydrolase [Candidatus Woesearchaeota archaeon]MBT6506133.1 peptidyl-tRNA hydrolase [Candidatus Woesearchaeota archaeon]